MNTQRKPKMSVADYEIALLSRLRTKHIVDHLVHSLHNVDMGDFFHTCGAPACLAGHMAVLSEFDGVVDADGSGASTTISFGVETHDDRVEIDRLLFSGYGDGAESAYPAEFDAFAARANRIAKRCVAGYPFALTKVSQQVTNFDTLAALFRLSYVAYTDPVERDRELFRIFFVKLSQVTGIKIDARYAWCANMLAKLRTPGMLDDIVVALDIPQFDFSHYFHPCGAPACLAGHMAVMPEFSLDLATDDKPTAALYGLRRGVYAKPCADFPWAEAESVLNTQIGSLLFSVRAGHIVGATRYASNAWHRFKSYAENELHSEGIDCGWGDILLAIFRLCFIVHAPWENPDHLAQLIGEARRTGEGKLDDIIPQSFVNEREADAIRLFELKLSQVTGVN